MFGVTWSHDVIKKYTILFGTLFNNIYITRDLTDGEIAQTSKVPLTYSPKDKMLARLNDDQSLTREIAIQLPRMGFQIVGMNYAPERKLNKVNKVFKQGTATLDYQYMPVPYDIQFELYVMTKNVDDGNKIIEQILPYFTPDWTSTVELVPSINGTYDIPLLLNGVSNEDSYEGDFKIRRAVTWTLSFTMKGYLFGPTKTQNVIKFTTVNFKVTNDPQTANSSLRSSAVVTTQPGLLANGSPTTNAQLTIAYTEINPDDDYDFIHDITEDI